MKKILFIIACLLVAPHIFALATVTSMAKMSFSALCSGIEVLATTNELSNTYRFHNQLLAESKKKHHSDAPDIIISYINELAKERDISPLHVVVATSDTYKDYYHDSITNTVYLSTTDAIELEKLLSTTPLSDIEQKKLNYHTSSIHHELTHAKNKDGFYTHIYENIIGAISSFFIIYTFDRALSKQLPILSTNYALHNSRKIIRGLAAIELTRYIVKSNLYSKYKEQRADNGIPNKKELLESHALRYEQAHNMYLTHVDNIKETTWQDIATRPEDHRKAFNTMQIYAMKILPRNYFNHPIVMDILFHARSQHPSNLRRAMRLRERIADLEKKQAEPIDAEIQQ